MRAGLDWKFRAAHRETLSSSVRLVFRNDLPHRCNTGILPWSRLSLALEESNRAEREKDEKEGDVRSGTQEEAEDARRTKGGGGHEELSSRDSKKMPSAFEGHRTRRTLIQRSTPMFHVIDP